MKHFSLSQSNMLQSVSSRYWAIRQMACSVCVRHMWVSERKQRTFLFLLFPGPFLRFCPSGSTHPHSSFPPYFLPSQGGGGRKRSLCSTHALISGKGKGNRVFNLNRKWKRLRKILLRSIKYFFASCTVLSSEVIFEQKAKHNCYFAKSRVYHIKLTIYFIIFFLFFSCLFFGNPP